MKTNETNTGRKGAKFTPKQTDRWVVIAKVGDRLLIENLSTGERRWQSDT